MCITFLDPINNVIYVVLLFAICKFPYDSLDKNLIIFIVIKDEIKVPWQQVTHTYHECWCVFVVWYNTMKQVKWKKTLANMDKVLHDNYFLLMMKNWFTVARTRVTVVINIVLILVLHNVHLCLKARGNK